jgi:TetR/AcrR family transcriptional regulator, transcriptional repressor for nem operon
VALERWVEDGVRRFSSGDYLNEPDPLQRALGFVDFMIEMSRAHPPGCMLGIFTQELAPTDAKVRKLAAQAFGGMTAIFEAIVVQAKARHAPAARFDPKSIAAHLFAVHQGAMILARAHQQPELVAEHLTHFRANLEALFRPASTPMRSPRGKRKAA